MHMYLNNIVHTIFWWLIVCICSLNVRLFRTAATSRTEANKSDTNQNSRTAAVALTDSVLSALPMINDHLTDDCLDRGAALITIMAGGSADNHGDLSIIPFGWNCINIGKIYIFVRRMCCFKERLLDLILERILRANVIKYFLFKYFFFFVIRMKNCSFTFFYRNNEWITGLMNRLIERTYNYIICSCKY